MPKFLKSRRTQVALVVVLAAALVLAVTQWNKNGTGAVKPRRAGPAAVERGPIVFVTNLRSAAVTVTGWDGDKSFDLAAGLGRQIPRLNSPAGPWPISIVDRSSHRSLYAGTLGADDPKQIELTSGGAVLLDVTGQQDAGDHEGPPLPLAKPPLGTGGVNPVGPIDESSVDHPFTSSAAGSSAGRIELASGVIPPNRPGCDSPKGRVVVSDWGTLSYGDIGGGAPTDVALPSPTGDLAYQLYGDPQITRLQDGDLLYLRVVALFTPISPKPAWFSYNNSYWRGGLAVWRSHCGNDWKLASVLDSNKVYDGKCAWPQGSASGHWFGGFDRPEMYTDPISGTVLVSVYCTGGTAPVFPPTQAFDNAFVVQWNPVTKKWTANGALSPHQAPNTISSNPGQLYQFRCEGWPTGPAKLYASPDNGGTFDGGIDPVEW